VTGVLIVAVLFVGEIELLAEAAGLLHLLVYGLMSIACVILRGARPLNYRPAFKVPLFPWVPLAGAAGTLAIACFIAPVVLAMGLGLIAFALLHYRFWSRRRTGVRGAWPTFVRRQILEPAIEHVERYGAAPVTVTTIVVAVGNPHTEQARLRVAAALLHDIHARIVALNVFRVVSGDTLDERVLSDYHQTISAREAALQEQAAAIERTGTQVVSSVPMAAGVLPAMLSTAEVSRASAVFLGWPESHGEHAPRFDLVHDVALYARSHLLILRESGPVPPPDVFVLAEPGEHGRFALGVATRLAAAWGVPLTAARFVPADTSSDEIVAIEAKLEARVAEVARAGVHALPAASVSAAVERAAQRHPFVVVPATSDDVGAMLALMRELSSLSGTSILLARAREGHSLEPWV